MAKRSQPKKRSSYTSSISLIISASATSATACTTKISPAGAHSTSRVTPTCCCGSRTHDRSSAQKREEWSGWDARHRRQNDEGRSEQAGRRASFKEVKIKSSEVREKPSGWWLKFCG